MKPMQPMEPMKPMEPMTPQARWWPAELGEPASSGAQSGMRYAFFPQPKRLLVERDGRRVTYDSGEHRISGVAQQQGGSQSLSFASQSGPVDLETLRRVD